MRLEFCTNNFFEVASMLMLLRSEEIVPRYQDLFMEQGKMVPCLTMSLLGGIYSVSCRKVYSCRKYVKVIYACVTHPKYHELLP